MILCFPMGGEGGRFKRAGYSLPKPMIQVGGKALIEWARASYALLDAFPLYIVREEDVVNGLEKYLIGGTMYTLKEKTSGPIETILTSEIHFAEEPLLIADCDSFLDPHELKQALTLFEAVHAEGGVTVRSTNDPQCSFTSISPSWWVEETREKDPFTEWSTTGPYWWKSGKQFEHLAKQALHKGITSISPVYNELLAEGGKVKAVPVWSFRHLGTPQELELFKKIVE